MGDRFPVPWLGQNYRAEEGLASRILAKLVKCEHHGENGP